jgi:LysM repeat protein
VKRGETLQSVANKLKVRRTDLAEANFLSSKTKLKPGQRLVIPRASTTLLAAGSGSAAAAAAPGTPSSASAGPPAPAQGAPVESTRVTYRVKRGDTLSSIARQFGTSVSALRTWNGLRTDRLMPGDRLTVYTNRTTSRP